jgi:N utilization substance protein A
MTAEELDQQIDRAVAGFSELEGMTEELAQRLVEQGYLSYDDLSVIEPDALQEMGGLSEEQVATIISQAERRAEEAERAAAEERRRQKELDYANKAAAESQPAATESQPATPEEQSTTATLDVPPDDAAGNNPGAEQPSSGE